jgi:hypothetical protein
MQVMECKRQTLYEWVLGTIEGHLELNSSLLFLVHSCLALHARKNCDLEFQHYIGWGRMPFCYEPSFFFKLCIFATPWIEKKGCRFLNWF